MLHLINRYCHGFVAVPVLNACARRGLFAALAVEGGRPLAHWVSRFGANDGHLKAAFRLLLSLEILARDSDGVYRPGRRWHTLDRFPADGGVLLRLPWDELLAAPERAPELVAWLDRSQAGWLGAEPLLADLLDGLLAIPLLLRLRESLLADPAADWLGCSALARAALLRYFAGKGWLTGDDPPRLSEPGRVLAERILIAGTVYSYQPMLARMDDLLFGNAGQVFGRDAARDETHLDRALNVVASGFQHERFFADSEDIVLRIFNQLPIESQPDYVADMGCGDGTFLKRIYAVIRHKTERGRQLALHPVVMLGVDYNRAALAETEKTLGDIPHRTLHGDIGEPAQLLETMAALGVTDPGKVLHIRSFLDHDRPFKAPRDAAALQRRAPGREHSVNVGRDGHEIASETTLQSLSEHLGRWADILGEQGAVILEVHSVEPSVVAAHLDQGESLHFDAYHAFSGQFLVEADEFLLAAAENGLFPRLDYSKRYPQTLPYCRITLNWFEKRPYRLRNACPADLPALVELDRQAWAEPLRAGEAVIAARIARYPQGQWLLEQDGAVIGAAYSQRIADVERLRSARYAQAADLFDADGGVLQLLGLNIRPDLQHLGLGDQLLDFLLYVTGLRGSIQQVAGITRCKNYVDHADLSMEQYLERCRATGQWDATVHFHLHHGAELLGTVPDYWPEDRDNRGAGVLIGYRLHEARGEAAVYASAAAPASGDTAATVEACVRAILGERRAMRYDEGAALMDMGLDSLDLLELRSLLSKRLNVPLEPMFFFSYGTPRAIKAYFSHQVGCAPRAGLVMLKPPVQAGVTSPYSGPVQVSSADIAVIGMACRFPGGADQPEAFWRLLAEGRDAVGGVPAERRELAAFFADAAQAAGISPQGGYLERVDAFDAAFFKLSPREARLVDPQHRLLLETAWEALERAGYAPLDCKDSGVFVGIFSHDYELLAAERNRAKDYDVYHAIGNSAAMAAGRLAYFYGFEGPAIALNTACSSSLVAVHEAARSLLSGDCRLALAGGVNLILAPDLSIAFGKSGMLSVDGRCKTFDAGADGYGRGEGCGLVVLKRLEDALTDGDNVLAVIKGGAVNQDGASNGLTAPNGMAQAALMRRALQDAGVEPAAVSYLEAHGTGTPLGDPVEMDAIAQVYGAGRQADNPLLVGSVKTNIGHTEAAAGIAGLLKVILSLQHEQTPAHVHFRHINPRIDLERIPARVPATATAWPRRPERPRLAAVSSFGFSGTNAHLIVAEAPAPESELAPAEASPLPPLLALSARDEVALRQLSLRYAEHFAGLSAGEAHAACATAATGRVHFAARLAIVGQHGPDIADQLTAHLEGRPSSACHVGDPEGQPPPRIAFLFTGQGSQYVGMGRELYQSQPVFREVFDDCDRRLRADLDVPLVDVLYAMAAADSPLNQTRYTQPALFALQYALARLWQSWGIRPDVVLGHSIGEYAAACLAGVFGLDDAIRLIAARGRLMQALPAGGGMVAVLAGREVVEAAVAPYAVGVAVAAYNGSNSQVISGAADDLQNIVTALRAQDISCTPLEVSHAFHSPLMSPMLDEFTALARRIDYRPPSLPFVSTLTGGPVGEELASADYWREHIIRPVRFAQAMAALLQQAPDALLEIGPKPVLISMGRRCVEEDAGALWLASLQAGVADARQLAAAAAALYARGAALDWAAYYRPFPCRKAVLPTYPFQRQRYWLDAVYPAAPAVVLGGGHPLLGSAMASPLADRQFAGHIAARRPDYLCDHQVDGEVLLPLAAYVEMALAAAAGQGMAGVAVRDALVEVALALDENGYAVQSVLTPEEGGAAFAVYSQAEPAGPWRKHFSCRLAASVEPSPPTGLAVLRQRLADPCCTADFYGQCAAQDIDFGPRFRCLAQLHRQGGEALGQVRLPADITDGAYRFHPLLLDAALQVGFALVQEGEARLLPFTIERLLLHGSPGASLWCYARRRPGPAAVVDLALYDEEGAGLGSVEGLLFRPRGKAAAGRPPDWSEWLYRVEWRRDETPALADALPSPGELSDRLSAWDSEPAAPGLRQTLNGQALAYVEAALLELGWQPQPEEVFDGDELAGRLAIAARHRRLFARMLAMLAEAGALSFSAGRWRVIRPLAADATPVAARPAGDGAEELALLGRCGPRLADVLRGLADPLDLLFPGNNLQALTAFYRDAASFRDLNRLLAQAVAAAAAGGRRLRILEIGGGTGSLTAALLPLLPAERIEYTFTDVSAFFTQRAAEAFGAFPFVDYRRLDIEREPAGQAFQAGYYDLVLAANVLHATRDLPATLRHAAALLAPGGELLLLEGVEATPWIDVSFGLTEGWWRFDDPLRGAYPLLGVEQWRQVLQGMGLESAMHVQAQADAPFRQAIIIARRVPAGSGKHWLILDEGQGVGEALEEQLLEAGQQCSRVPALEDHAAALHSAEQAFGPIAGVVDLTSLAITPAVGKPPERLMADLESLCSPLLVRLQNLAANRSEPLPLWLVSCGAQAVLESEVVAGPEAAVLWGLRQVIALEQPELAAVCLDLQDDTDAAQAARWLAGEILRGATDEARVAYRDDGRYLARLARLPQGPRPCGEREGRRWSLATRGSLDGLQYLPQARRAPGEGEIEIRAVAAGLNFIDVLDAVGLLPFARASLGVECAGIVAAVGPGVEGLRVGDAVMAVGEGCLGEYVTLPASLAAPMPAEWSFQQAASVPVAFLTACHALIEVGGLAAGETVLIHAAAGATGMAAVCLALAMGAEVYATASPAKWPVLHAMGVKQVMNSRTLDFAEQLRATTQGRGVDVVLNSLGTEFAEQSLSLLAPGGRFLEIGKNGLLSQEQAQALAPQGRYLSVDLLELIRRQPRRIAELFRALEELRLSGAVSPLPCTTFALDDALAAFLHMQQAKHIGKIVLTTSAAPVRADGVYLITGGCKGLGLETARWLVERGARHLILLGRSPLSEAGQVAVEALRQNGAAVDVLVADVTDRPALQGALENIRRSGHVLRGVIHSVGVLDDGVLAQQNWPRFAKVIAPKALGAWHLHQLTESDPLDFFVLYSSVVGLLGNAGQANHAAANAFLDALAAYRRGLGLPALSIAWCGWSQVGSAAERRVSDRIRAGMGGIDTTQGLDILAALLGGAESQVGVMPMDWPEFLRHSPEQRFYADFAAPAMAATAPPKTASWRAVLEQVEPAQRRPVLAEQVKALLAEVLGMEPSALRKPELGFFDQGMDSLTAVEFRNKLNQRLGLSLSASAVFDYPNLAALASHIESLLFAPPAVNMETEEEAPSELDDMSTEEAALLLLKELQS